MLSSNGGTRDPRSELDERPSRDYLLARRPCHPTRRGAPGLIPQRKGLGGAQPARSAQHRKRHDLLRVRAGAPVVHVSHGRRTAPYKSAGPRFFDGRFRRQRGAWCPLRIDLRVPSTSRTSIALLNTARGRSADRPVEHIDINRYLSPVPAASRLHPGNGRRAFGRANHMALTDFVSCSGRGPPSSGQGHNAGTARCRPGPKERVPG